MISKRKKLLVAGVSSLVAIALFTVSLLAAFGLIKISAEEAGNCPLTVANGTMITNGFSSDESGNLRFTIIKGAEQLVVLEQTVPNCQKLVSGNNSRLSNPNPSVAEVSSQRINIKDGDTRTPALNLNIGGASVGTTDVTINNQQLSIDVIPKSI